MARVAACRGDGLRDFSRGDRDVDRPTLREPWGAAPARRGIRRAGHVRLTTPAVHGRPAAFPRPRSSSACFEVESHRTAISATAKTRAVSQLQPLDRGTTLHRMQDDEAAIVQHAHAVAAAIAQRDAPALTQLLAEEFVTRRPGAGSALNRTDFIASVQQIPAEIVFVRLEHVEADAVGDAGLVTGVQHAQVRVNGETIDERRPFVDWFVRTADGWRLHSAVEIAPLG